MAITKNLENFQILVAHNLLNLDFDCIYPLSVELGNIHGWTDEQLATFCLLYMTYYNESSALSAFRLLRYRGIKQFPSTKLDQFPIDTARRALRGDRINRHLKSWYDTTAGMSLVAYLQQGFTDDKISNWHQLLENLGVIYGNGRWGCYSSADMFHKVCNFPVEPPDTGWRGSSGPRRGLELLAAIKDLDKVELALFTDKSLTDTARAFLPSTYWRAGWDYAVLESLFCDFAGLTNGSYYPGRNLDRMMVRMNKVLEKTGPNQVLPSIFEARKLAFNHNELGELNGWFSIDKERKKVFAKTGEILGASVDRRSIAGATSLMNFIQTDCSG